MANQTINSKLKVRSDSGSNWASSDLILLSGEPGYDSTNRALKFGDGTNTWASLPDIRYTATEILTKLKTVDGAGSGLDAALLTGASLSTDGTFAANSDTLIPSQKAIKTFIDAQGAGDMLKATYDPTNKNADAFSLANMAGDATHRLVTDTEKSTWNGKQASITASGILKGDGSGGVSGATAGTDYATPGLLVGSLSLPTSGYSGSGPYTKTFTVTGASTNTDKRYLLIPDWSSTAATRALEKTAWNLIDDYEITATNTLTVTVTAIPATAVSFSLKEVV
jgi:hypothetical protein